MTLRIWGGNMTLEEFNKYMNTQFDKMIDRVCLENFKINENQK